MLEGQRLLIKYPDNPNTVLLSSLVTKSQKISISSDSSCKKVTGQQEVITKLKKNLLYFKNFDPLKKYFQLQLFSLSFSLSFSLYSESFSSTSDELSFAIIKIKYLLKKNPLKIFPKMFLHLSAVVLYQLIYLIIN